MWSRWSNTSTCDSLPPSLGNVTVVDIGDTWANVSWNLNSTADSSSLDSYYAFELMYKVMGYPVEHNYHISKYESYAVIRNLQQKTPYYISIYAANFCGRTTPVTGNFSTTQPISRLDPHVNHLMIHEVFLTAFVIFLWLLIVRYFLVTYSEVSFVSALSYGGYSSTRYGYDDESEATRSPKPSGCDLLDVREDKHLYSSRMSLLVNPAMHKWSANQQIPFVGRTRWQMRRRGLSNLSEKWRSETELEIAVDLSTPATVLRHVKSDVQLPSMMPSFCKVEPEFIEEKPSEIHLQVPRKQSQRIDEYSSKQSSKASANTASFESATDTLETPNPPSPTRTHSAASSSKNSLSSSSSKSSRRKVSEVLLGKATKDIRRRPSLKEIGRLGRILGPSPAAATATTPTATTPDPSPTTESFPKIIVRRPTRRRHMATVLEEEQQSLLGRQNIAERLKQKQVALKIEDDGERQESVESYHTAHESFTRGDALSVL